MSLMPQSNCSGWYRESLNPEITNCHKKATSKPGMWSQIYLQRQNIPIFHHTRANMEKVSLIAISLTSGGDRTLFMFSFYELIGQSVP